MARTLRWVAPDVENNDNFLAVNIAGYRIYLVADGELKWTSQVPGPWNALGQVKFIFPNPHFVFLHDTNHRELFVTPSRPFSSGCVRAVDSKKTRRVILEQS